MAVLRFSLRCDRIDVDNGYRDVDSSAFGAPASQLAWSSDGGASEAARYLTHEAIGLAGFGFLLTLVMTVAIVARALYSNFTDSDGDCGGRLHRSGPDTKTPLRLMAGAAFLVLDVKRF